MLYQGVPRLIIFLAYRRKPNVLTFAKPKNPHRVSRTIENTA